MSLVVVLVLIVARRPRKQRVVVRAGRVAVHGDESRQAGSHIHASRHVEQKAALKPAGVEVHEVGAGAERRRAAAGGGQREEEVWEEEERDECSTECSTGLHRSTGLGFCSPTACSEKNLSLSSKSLVWRDRKRRTPKGGRRLAHHTPLLKIPVWWRRAVLPSLPCALGCLSVFFLSFFFRVVWRPVGDLLLRSVCAVQRPSSTSPKR